MEQEEFPKILYKYRSFQENILEGKKYQRDALIKGELYLANYDELNDPFDLKIRKKIEGLPEEDKIMKILFLLARADGSKSFALLWQEANDIHANNLKEDPDVYKKRSIEATKKANAIIRRGIFCLCEKNNDILMWSHYGNSNQGFCIGYNTKMLIDFIRQNCDLLAFLKVKYFSEYPEYKISFAPKNIEELISNLTSKSIIWSYEKEWRLIIHNQTSIAISIPNDIVEEIILGSNVQPETEQEILAIQKQKYPNAKVFKVEPDDSEFKLNILPYNY